MAKSMAARPGRSVFICQNCGYQAPKWLGRCPDCGAWSSMAEEMTPSSPVPEVNLPPRRRAPQPLIGLQAPPEVRQVSGLTEFDRTLGGSVVHGSVVLLGGDPGIGKSTLMLQVLDRLCRQGDKGLYISGEESETQIKLRSDRLGLTSPGLLVATETCLENILKVVEECRPAYLALDSIQTLYTATLPAAPGSLTQVRETAFRLLRTVKNRFGPTHELGIFEMQEAGLVEVTNPSGLFMAERSLEVPGAAVIPSLEGSRPILVEVQALVSPSSLAQPRRQSMGVDPGRVSLLVAILEKRVGLAMGGQDLYVNVAGGVRLTEPAADLGVAMALASSFLDRPVPADTLIFGEVGLTGEVRAVSAPELRLKEGHKLGFKRALLARRQQEHLGDFPGLELIGVETLAAAIRSIFP